MSNLRVRPVSLQTAQRFIKLHHRHHGTPKFHRFSLGAINVETGQLASVLVANRPAARLTQQDRILEVCRVATDGTPNSCSILYGAAARAAKAMGFESIQTFTLETEDGASLRASGWTLEDASCGGESWENRSGRNPTPPGRRKRYAKRLNPTWPKYNEDPPQSPQQKTLPI